MRLGEFIGDWHALAILFIAGVIPNQIWRWLGLWFGGGLDEGFIAFTLARRSILAGVVAGEAFMLAGQWWMG